MCYTYLFLLYTGALTQAIRNFAKGLEPGLIAVLSKTELPQELVRLKVSKIISLS